MYKTFTAACLAAAAFINGVAASQLPTGSTGTDEMGEGFDKVTIKVNGAPKELYVVYDRETSDGPVWNTGNDRVVYDKGARLYLSTKDSSDPQYLFKPNLLGGRISFSTDLSEIRCGCKTLFYGVPLHADDNADPFHHCDTRGDGAMCPSFEFLHANRWNLRSEAHACKKDFPDGDYTWCASHSSCPYDDLLSDKTLYGWDPDAYASNKYLINSGRRVQVETHFIEEKGQFVSYETTISQYDREHTIMVNDPASCQYRLGDMTEEMKSMALVFEHVVIEDPKEQLEFEQGVCKGSCERESTSLYDKIEIWTGDYVEPAVEYKYDRQCLSYDRHTFGDKCEGQCGDSECFSSWEHADPLERNSESFSCRCLPKQRAPSAYSYDGKLCDEEMGTCRGSKDCYESWPKDDARGDKSPEAMCRDRGQVKAVNAFESTTLCPNDFDGNCGSGCEQCVYGIRTEDRSLGCYCAVESKTDVLVWGEAESKVDGGDIAACGELCVDCRMSWHYKDADMALGTTAAYRCRDWKESEVVAPRVRAVSDDL